MKKKKVKIILTLYLEREKKGWWYDIFPYLVSFRERKQKEQEGKIQYLTLPFKIAYFK